MVKEEFKYKGHCHGLPLEQENIDMENPNEKLMDLRKGWMSAPYVDGLQEEAQSARSYDPVERPSHYTQGPMEVIDIIEKYGFCDDFRLGNCVKYLFRHNLKGAALQDLKKARWYLDRYINALEKVETKG